MIKIVFFYFMLLKNIETLSYEEEMVRCAGTFYRNVIAIEHCTDIGLKTVITDITWHHVTPRDMFRFMQDFEQAG